MPCAPINNVILRRFGITTRVIVPRAPEYMKSDQQLHFEGDKNGNIEGPPLEQH